jgi:feruloyl esterase
MVFVGMSTSFAAQTLHTGLDSAHSSTVTSNEANVIGASNHGHAQSVEPAQSCNSLSSTDFTTLRRAPTSILSTKVAPAAHGQPEYCDINGYILGQIQFELKLPTRSWNGKYFQTGCGGFCGFVPIQSCGQALGRNYAVAAENSGHVGGVFNALWAYDGGATGPAAAPSRQRQVNWAWRSPHVLSIAAKAIIRQYYHKSPTLTFFQGCSTGGRQAMMEGERFPSDFDGIIAGDAAIRQNYLAPVAQSYLERVNRDKNGNVILSKSKLPVVYNAMLAECDKIDGRADGVVDDPTRCHFDPGSIQCKTNQGNHDKCLTAEQVAVVRKFYGGAHNSSGQLLFPGLARGSESGWSSSQGALGTDKDLSGTGKYATAVLRYLAFKQDPGPSYSINDFDYDQDIKRLRPMARVYNSDDPDLRAFRDRGGKLIMYHGWADPLITPYSTTTFYEAAARISGGFNKTQRWFRLFMIPGMWHCEGGPGADHVDWLHYLDAWVEQGHAPSVVHAQKFDPNGNVTETRLVRPYPKTPADDTLVGRENPKNIGAAAFKSASPTAPLVKPYKYWRHHHPGRLPGHN